MLDNNAARDAISKWREADKAARVLHTSIAELQRKLESENDRMKKAHAVLVKGLTTSVFNNELRYLRHEGTTYVISVHGVYSIEIAEL